MTAPVEPSGMQVYIPLEQSLVRYNGEETTMGQILSKDVKLVGIYYSMHNCPPCRAFTPLLSAIYEEINEDVH